MFVIKKVIGSICLIGFFVGLFSTLCQLLISIQENKNWVEVLATFFATAVWGTISVILLF